MDNMWKTNEYLPDKGYKIVFLSGGKLYIGNRYSKLYTSEKESISTYSDYDFNYSINVEEIQLWAYYSDYSRHLSNTLLKGSCDEDEY